MHRKIVLLFSVAAFLMGLFLSKSMFCPPVQAACNPQTNTSLPETLAPNYFTYSPQRLNLAKNQGKVVLYFFAPWCTSCTSLDGDLQEKKVTIPDGMTLLRVDYDQAYDLKEKYAVAIQHTFVQIDPQGRVLSTWVGGGIEELIQNTK